MVDGHDGPHPLSDATSMETPATVTLVAVPGGGNPDPDANLRKAAAEGLPVRIRLQPTVLLLGPGHMPLTSTRWILDVPSVELVGELMAELDGFIRGWVKARG